MYGFENQNRKKHQNREQKISGFQKVFKTRRNQELKISGFQDGFKTRRNHELKVSDFQNHGKTIGKIYPVLKHGFDGFQNRKKHQNHAYVYIQ